jgi:hypothetical protein
MQILSYCFCVWAYLTENTATVAILETEQIKSEELRKEQRQEGRKEDMIKTNVCMYV